MKSVEALKVGSSMQTLSPAWNLSPAATTKWYSRALPSLADLAFLLPVVLLFAKLKGAKTLFADGDTGWHIRTGEWIIAHRAVPKADLFSFTMPHQPWFAWEWAWDVIFAAVHRLAGLAGVGFLNVGLLALFSLLLYTLARRVSQNDAVSFFVTAVAIWISSIHWLARPHLVSLLFTVGFLHLIQTAQEGTVRALYFAPLLMICWTNLHGGFVAGLLILLCQAVGLTLSELLVSSGQSAALRAALEKTRPYWLTLLLSLAATFVNPYGWHLHEHVIRYLTDKDLLDKISEFQSISFHSDSAPLFEIMLMLSAFAAFWKLQSAQLAPPLLIALWAHFALVSARHIPIFVIVATPFVASLLQDVLLRLRHVPGLSDGATTISEICDELRAMERPARFHLVPLLGMVAVAALFAVGKGPFAPQFDADTFPLQALPIIQASTLGHAPASAAPRIFTYDQWGDYLIYRLYPSQRVFFDGRSDFYGKEFVRVNQRIMDAEYDWKKLLWSYRIQMVILKPEAPLSAVLKITPGSKILFDDGKVIVFQIDGIYARSLGGREASVSENRASLTWQGTAKPAASANHG